jgi:hypothetical protein
VAAVHAVEQAFLKDSLTRLPERAATITANASGTVHTAGCANSSVCQPDNVGPNTVTSTAAPAAPPPVGIPEAAPVSVSPRHQMRRGLTGPVRADSTIRARASARA